MSRQVLSRGKTHHDICILKYFKWSGLVLSWPSLKPVRLKEK